MTFTTPISIVVLLKGHATFESYEEIMSCYLWRWYMLIISTNMHRVVLSGRVNKLPHNFRSSGHKGFLPMLTDQSPQLSRSCVLGTRHLSTKFGGVQVPLLPLLPPPLPPALPPPLSPALPPLLPPALPPPLLFSSLQWHIHRFNVISFTFPRVPVFLTRSYNYFLLNP